MRDDTWLLLTQDGEVHDPDAAVVEDALRAAAEDEDAFVVLQRPDGHFVQFDGQALEVGGDDRLHRLDTLAAARGAFERFRTGRNARGDLPWRDVTGILRQLGAGRRRRMAGLAVAALLVVGTLLLLTWLVLPSL